MLSGACVCVCVYLGVFVFITIGLKLEKKIPSEWEGKCVKRNKIYRVTIGNLHYSLQSAITE